MNNLKLDENWKDILRDELADTQLNSFLENAYASRKQIYPPKSEIFAALNITPFDNVKVVVIGQDPYHGPGEAHGLCFSVRQGVNKPRSLQNIFKELKREFSDFREPASGDLTKWAEQGVLLLNRALTVERGKARSHRSQWKRFTDKIIEKLAAEEKPIVFILWGKDAQELGAKVNASEITRAKHCVLESAHPSGLSCYRGFFGNNHFTCANKYLLKTGQEPINWSL
ncbi:MAG TPA: uracil-DNA glycosylase [Candidatus Solibacter sp.]|nr:uracil-DNA glycosylase [Candidatus Solibacter sp.]